MMDLTLYQVDAFTDQVFKGNPAAVIPLTKWLDDETMQSIALENNLAETAYFVPTNEDGHFELRWFTPEVEVDFCGHATLATAYVILEKLQTTISEVTFSTKVGPLIVKRGSDENFIMDFPSLSSELIQSDSLEQALLPILITSPKEMHRAQDLMIVMEDEGDVRALSPDAALAPVLAENDFRGLIVTAPGDSGSGYDFVSRFFAPNQGIPEDPVTGSAHCLMAPYWAKRLGKTELQARQISPRGGDVKCRVLGDRVELQGACAFYMKATIRLPAKRR
jgi:PhzF family phenazine biosynthesis protein